MPSLDVAAVGINNEDVPVITIGPRIRPMFRRVTQHVKTETAAVESPSRSYVKEPIPFPVIVPLETPENPSTYRILKKIRTEPLDHLQVI